MMKNLTFVSASLIAMVCSAQAVMIAPFPGLPKMIEEADAIAIIRVDEHLKASPGSDLRTTHRCYVYQSLKGNLPKSERVVLSLIDTRTSFVSPFSIGSTHLAFLSTNQIGGESTFRNMQYEGSILRLSPFGHESEPDGWDLERKIKILLERSIAYRDREQQREKELFLAAITGMSSPLRRELEEGHRTKGDIEQRAKSYRISPILDFDGITAKAVASYQSDGNYWTIQVNLFSKGREDVEKERPPTLKVFNRAGTPLTVISDNGYSDIGNLFVMYRVEAESIEEIANLEVEFKSIKRRFQFRSPKEEDARYFIHFGFQADVEPRRILTTEFRTGEPFHALAGDLQELKGLIEVRDGKFHAVHLKGNTGSQGGVYAGSLTNGIPVFAQRGVGSGGLRCSPFVGPKMAVS